MKFVIVEYATCHHVVIMHNLKDMEVEHSFQSNMMICNVTRVFYFVVFAVYLFIFFICYFYIYYFQLFFDVLLTTDA